MKKHLLTCLIVCLSSSVNADDFSFTGNFTTDNDVQLFDFSVGTTSEVTLRTWSFAGGTNAQGELISTGGFDPILALFDNTGNLIDQNDDGAGVDIDPASGAAFDTLLTSLLTAGDYTVSIMQFDNFATGPKLANGFDGSNATNFDDRTNLWAFDILNVNTAATPPAAVPAPAAVWLFASGLIGLTGISKKKYKKSHSA